MERYSLHLRPLQVGMSRAEVLVFLAANYIYIYIYIGIHVYIYIYIYIYICIYIYVYSVCAPFRWGYESRKGACVSCGELYIYIYIY